MGLANRSSKDVYETATVKELLRPFRVEPQTARLRGVLEEIPDVM